MNSKIFLVPLLAVIAVFAGIVSASAAGIVVEGSVQTVFNDVILSNETLASNVGDTVPVQVLYKSNVTASDVKVKVWIDGFKDDISASTKRSNVISGIWYTELLSLQLPSSLKATNEDVVLYVSIVSADKSDIFVYNIKMQRTSYAFDILSVETDTQISAGESVPVTVVVKNTGFETLDDGYVVVSIPALGVSSKGYFGDLLSQDSYDDDDVADSVEKTVYVRVPASAKTGVYDMSIKVYNHNDDATATFTKAISVETPSSTILPAISAQDLKAGETKNFELIVVNSGNEVRIYKLQTLSSTGLDVSAPSVITVGPQSSTTVPIKVTALNSAETGSHAFTVTVDDTQVSFVANITSSGASTSVVALTVILVIVFVVLLVVLIVLLTRKERPTDEVETSYY